MPRLKFKRLTWTLPTSGLLILCIWQWVHSSQKMTHFLDHHALEHSPNFTIMDLQYRQYDVNGIQTHFLEAPKMHHIPNQDQHVFSQPHLVVTEPKQAPWEIHADYGTAISKGDTITLDHHVAINQHKPNEETELTTEHLTYYPKEKKATSSDDVHITQGDSHIHSKGMVADLAENHIQLHQARGRHVRSAT